MLGPGSSEHLLPLTSRMQRVFSFTMEECRDLKHESVEIPHLILGLLREEKGVAAHVLLKAGLSVDRVRASFG